MEASNVGTQQEGRSAAVFVRNATGLTKEIGWLDTLIYNVNIGNVGIGLLFLLWVGFGFFPGANPWLSMLIAIAMAVPFTLAYALLAAAMPRSGGDYVYVSRNVSPVLGFVTSWNWVIWMLAFVGIPAAFLAQYGIAPLFRSLGGILDSPGLVSAGAKVGSPTGLIVIGTILIALFAIVFSIGTNVFLRVQKWTFLIAMVGVVATIVVVVTSTGDYATKFNAYVQSVGGKPGAAAIAQRAATDMGLGGAFSAKQTFMQATWWLFCFAFCITSSFLGGEVRQASRSQILGMQGAIVYSAFWMGLTVAAFAVMAGLKFVGGIGAADPSALGLSTTPVYTELAVAARPNIPVALLICGTFIFWSYTWLPGNFLACTRGLLAWSFDRLMPEKLAYVSERRHTPTVAIVVVAVVAEISLVLYARGKLTVLVGVFGWVLSYGFGCIAAMLFPYRHPEVFESSSVNWRVGRVPVISIVGGLGLIGVILAEYLFYSDPIYGLVTSNVTKWGTAIVLVAGFLVYFAAKWVQRSRGVYVERAFAVIPPE
jgi:amino acid transporter